jgi:SPX domain protein involved in polyphosphate accumulation
MNFNGRYELKYFIPHDEAENLIKAVAPYVMPDTHAHILGDGVPRYTIRSVYFDNRAHKCYHEKIDGMRDRRKLRIRSYVQPGPDDTVFFEIKNRANLQVIKERASLPMRHAVALLDGGLRVGALALPPGPCKVAERFLHFRALFGLEPIVAVVYERTPFVGREDDTIRLTVDVNLRAEDQRGAECLFALRPSHPVPLPGAILELKFDWLMPEWMRQVVRQFDLRQESISKYCHCVDAVVFKELEVH